MSQQQDDKTKKEAEAKAKADLEMKEAEAKAKATAAEAEAKVKAAENEAASKRLADAKAVADKAAKAAFEKAMNEQLGDLDDDPVVPVKFFLSRSRYLAPWGEGGVARMIQASPDRPQPVLLPSKYQREIFVKGADGKKLVGDDGRHVKKKIWVRQAEDEHLHLAPPEKPVDVTPSHTPPQRPKGGQQKPAGGRAADNT